MSAAAAMTVRRATTADLDDLVPLFDAYRRFYERDGDRAAAHEYLRERLENGESIVFLAYSGRRPAGFVQLYPSFSSVALARIHVLNDLFVEPGARRNGVGRRLIAAAVEYARSAGAVRLTLSTARDNTAAQALYESLGWRRDERFLVYDFGVD